MKRIVLYLATNLAIIAVLCITLRLLGIESLLDQQGVDLNMQSLLIYAALLGFSGSLISLAISKWTAKRMTGAQVITSPTNDTERWLVNTVQKQAQQADIDMPEVAIYNSSAPNAFATGMNKNNALVAC
jgi:heat shock protein HtpX